MGQARVNEGNSMNRVIPGVLFVTTLLITFQPVLADIVEETGCVHGEENPDVVSKTNKDAEKDFYVRVYTEAQCLRLAAARAGAEWLKTESLLVRSQEESENENWDTAIQLAQKARFQAETALRQAAYEASVWKHRVLKTRESNS